MTKEQGRRFEWLTRKKQNGSLDESEERWLSEHTYEAETVTTGTKTPLNEAIEPEQE